MTTATKQPRLGRWQRIAAQRIDELLRENQNKETMHLWYLCENADAAARAAGMRAPELFDSIYAYEKLLPPGSRCGQVGTPENSMYSVFNPYFSGVRMAKVVHAVPGPMEAGIDSPSAMRPGYVQPSLDWVR
jgi:hypothetical protein